jgi:tRNA(Ile)-lysidine synthase
MTELEKKVTAALRRYEIDPADRLVVAVSGGADSTALLDAVVRLWRRQPAARDTIIVAHLNHLLRGPDADADEAFVIAMAAAYGVTVVTDRIPVAEEAARTGENLEATARRFRYAFLQKIALDRNATFVLTGHTCDDQVETLLMRMLRGTGPEGLRGIHPLRPLGDRSMLARPLLEVSRREVLAHCEHYRLDFRNDQSNFSPDFTRNRIRHELVPLLRSLNPRADDALLRLGLLSAEDGEYLTKLAEERRLAPSATPPDSSGNRLYVPKFYGAPAPLRRRMLRGWLRDAGGRQGLLDAGHLAAVEKLLLPGQSGRKIELPGHWTVLREFDWLTLLDSAEETGQPDFQPVPLQEGRPQAFGQYLFHLLPGAEKLPAPAKGMAVLRGESLPAGLFLRSRQPGDAYIPAGRRNKIKLKTLLIRNKILLSERDTHPVLVSADNQIIWSPGLPVARDFDGQASREKGAEDVVLIIAQKVRKL